MLAFRLCLFSYYIKQRPKSVGLCVCVVLGGGGGGGVKTKKVCENKETNSSPSGIYR